MVICMPSLTWNVALIAACCGCLGCGKGRSALPPPKTAPVTGVVRLGDGTPMPKGFVQLEAVEGSPLMMSGVVTSGQFSLTTSFGNAVLPGVVPGRYRVLVTPDFSAEPRTVRFERLYDIGASGTNIVLELPAN